MVYKNPVTKKETNKTISKTNNIYSIDAGHNKTITPSPQTIKDTTTRLTLFYNTENIKYSFIQ